MTAAAFDADPARGKVDLVMKDGDLFRTELVETRSFASGTSTLIIEGLGFQEQKLDRA